METGMTAGAFVRRAELGDEEALSLVGQATFLETFAGVLDGTAIVSHCVAAHAPKRYRRWLEDPFCALWLARANDGRAPVGYAVLAPPDLPGADHAHDLELKRIYLLGRFQGGGLGRQLMASAISHACAVGARRLLLGVYAGNASAIAFYARHGFNQVATRQFNVGGRAYDDCVLGLGLST